MDATEITLLSIAWGSVALMLAIVGGAYLLALPRKDRRPKA